MYRGRGLSKEGKALVAVAIAIVLALAVGWATYEPPNQQQAQGQTNSATVHQGSPSKSFWDWTTHDPVGFYTFVLAIFTGLLALVAGVQILYLIRADKRTAEQIRLAREEFTATHRPRLRVRAVTYDLGDPKFTVVVVNVGESAAVIERCAGVAKALKARNARTQVMPMTDVNLRLASGQAHYFEFPSLFDPSPADRVELSHGVLTLVCHGAFRYTNQMGSAHYTTGFGRAYNTQDEVFDRTPVTDEFEFED